MDAALKATSSKNASRRPAKILVVEDNPIVLLGVTHMLTMHGYDVAPATTGADCLRMVREFAPDLVLLDVVLPDANGVEVCRKIKQHGELGRTFVVLSSAREVSPEGQISGLEAGADAYITRPIENRELLARLQALLRLQQAEAALREANATLEARVLERTAELSAANQALREEVTVRRRAEEAQRHLAERLSNLHLIDRAILAAESPAAIAGAALERIQHLLPCEAASVVELDVVEKRVVVLAVFNAGRVCVGDGWELPLEQARLLETLRSGRPRFIHDAANLFQPPTTSASGPAKTWRTLVDLPMLAEDDLIGALNLATDRAAAFTPGQVEIAQELADQLAVAIRDARLVEQSRAGREHLRALSLRLVEVQERERQFVARELHDQIGQMLTGLKLNLDRVKGGGDGESRGGLAEALLAIDDLLARVRQLSLDLRPPMLDDLGLLTALHWHFKRYSEQTGVRVVFKHSPLPARLPLVVETAVFRLVQEALTNVARHADVTEAAVRLWLSETHLRIQVEDAGAGFAPEAVLAADRSSGLAGMRERATLLGGDCLIESTPGNGTKVTIELPMNEPAAPN